MTLEEIRRKKAEHGYTCSQLSELSGVPLSTVQKVIGGVIKSPRYQTIQALSAVFSDHVPQASGAPGDRESADRVSDAAPAYGLRPGMPERSLSPEELNRLWAVYSCGAGDLQRYPRQGSYTLDDYLALPDEQRVELIDGVFFDMGAPTIPHQMIGGDVYAQFLAFVREHKGKCMPFIAPTDVQLDRDNKTILQPDVMIVCDRSKITRARIFGAPDFVLEVLSPGTRSKDILIKTRKYRAAGVREYWLADPVNETVTKYLFTLPDGEHPDGDIRMKIYPFSEPVPVTAFHDECSINFREIAETYAFLDR